MALTLSEIDFVDSRSAGFSAKITGGQIVEFTSTNPDVFPERAVWYLPSDVDQMEVNTDMRAPIIPLVGNVILEYNLGEDTEDKESIRIVFPVGIRFDYVM